MPASYFRIDPLRVLAGDICLDMAEGGSLPYFARTSILRFILGPADFIMHHLETRIRLTDIITHLVRQLWMRFCTEYRCMDV